MMLLRNRLRPASVEYEKGHRLAGGSHWLFAVKLGRTHLALGEPAEAGKVVAAAASMYPELPWPHLIAGQAALAQGDARQAAAFAAARPGHQPLRPGRALRPGRSLPAAPRRPRRETRPRRARLPRAEAVGPRAGRRRAGPGVGRHASRRKGSLPPKYPFNSPRPLAGAKPLR